MKVTYKKDTILWILVYIMKKRRKVVCSQLSLNVYILKAEY